MTRRFTILLLALITATTLQAQVLGGRHAFDFLNLSPSARVTALGGLPIAVVDDDVNLAFINPALANAAMHQQLSFSHNFHLADINNGYVAYGHHLPKSGVTLHGGVQYISYGDFNATNVLGEIEGAFDANEYAITLGGSYPIDERLSLGANVKFITSSFEQYQATGIATDIGATYQDTSRNIVISILARHLGAQLGTYHETASRDPLPFDLQIGISKRLKYLPFRFSITYHHLDQWDVRFDDPALADNTIFFGELPNTESPSSIWFDQLFRHFVFSGEFLFGKKDNFRLRLGYNHMLRQELSLDNFRSLAGFSYGLGIKINRFRIEFGRATYHLAGGSTHLSIATNFKEFK